MTGRLTVPFYTGGEVEARVRQAKHTHVQRLQEIEQARTEVQAQVVTAWSQLEAAQAAVESDTTASTPTASRWPACARKSGSASARCWTC